MITLHRAEARQHVRKRQREVWRTSRSRDNSDPFGAGFEVLRLVDEVRLLPGAPLKLVTTHNLELLTYVSEGALTYLDSAGRSGILQAGEFRCMTGRRNVQYSEANASRVDSAHLFRIGLQRSLVDADARPEQRRFSAARRKGEFCVVAAADSRAGSLRIRQNARVYSALLHDGQHVIHELEPEWSAWLHLILGGVVLGDQVLTPGDGVGVTDARVLSFTAREETEVLVIEVCALEPALLSAATSEGSEH